MSRLEAEALRRALGECTIGREIVVLEETTSTNDAVLQMATPNTREGLVLFAEHQTVEEFAEEVRPHAMSLAIALDQPVDRQEFAVALLRNLDRTYREIFASYEGGSSSLLLDVKNQAAKSH